MRRIFWASVLIGIVSGGSFAQTENYKISGTVLDHITNQPLPKTLIQIFPIQEGQWLEDGLSAIADGQGQFAFAHLAPGKYTLLAGRSKSSMQFFQGEEGYSTAIAVGPGLNSEGIVFPLPTLGAISGTVLDEEGTGVKNATVYLYQQHIESGKLQVAGSGQQQTKSSGSFRFSHLQPGTYFLAVHGHPWYAGNDAKNREFDVTYPLMYYSGATDASAASPITVAEGATVDLQMALHPVPSLHVRLISAEENGVSVSPMVAAIGPGGVRIMLNGNPTIVNNHLELSGIAPGAYELSAIVFTNGVGRTVGTKIVDLQSDAEVDLSNVSHCSITGHVAFSGAVRAPNPLQLYLSRGADNLYLSVDVGADGKFQVPTLPPGQYQIGVNQQSSLSFQSIAVKGGKFRDGMLDLPDGATVQLSIAISNSQTALTGVVLRDRKPVSGAMVLLLPEDTDRTDLVRRDQSDSDGTFTLNSVPPGQYRILALDNGHGLAYGEPAAIKPYLALSQTVTVNAGKQPPLQVDVQTRLP